MIQRGCGNAQPRRDRGKSLVAGPQTRVFGQQCRCKQVRVDIADAATEQAVMLDELHYLVMVGDDGLIEQVEVGQDEFAVRRIAERNLSTNKGVHQHLFALKQMFENGVAAIEIIHPNGGVSDDHSASK